MKSARLPVLALAAALLGGCSLSSVTPEAVDGFKSKADALEREGALRPALAAWKVALTANPGDSTARQRKEKLEAQIAQSVAEHMALAERALERSSILEARRHYLTVLALDPNHGAAFEALRTKIREIRTLAHGVRAGDTFTSVAELYYGDRSRADVIWETNGLSPNARLAAGTTLMVPEIAGVPFIGPKTAKPATPTTAPATPTKTEVAAVEPNYVNPLLSNARDALGSGDFDTAIASADRYLSSNPRSSEGIEVKRNALYEQAKAFFNQRRFPDSLKLFEQLARLAPNYLDSSRLSAEARARVVQDNYSDGVRLFREEKLSEAIARWRTVLEYEPSHANAKKNIEQAERMLQNLKSQQQKTGR